MVEVMVDTGENRMPDDVGVGSSVSGVAVGGEVGTVMGASVGTGVVGVADGEVEGPKVSVSEGGEVVSAMGAFVGTGVVGVPVCAGVGPIGDEVGAPVGEVATHIQPASIAKDQKSVQPSGSTIP